MKFDRLQQKLNNLGWKEPPSTTVESEGSSQSESENPHQFLHDAFRSVFPKPAYQECSSTLHEIGGKVAKGTVISASTYEVVNSFYYDHQQTIFAITSRVLTLNVHSKDFDLFIEYLKIFMKGLDSLAKLHPFITVAVIAFKFVVPMHLKRRDNNEKVIAVQAQIQDTMIALFQLRNIKDPHEKGPDNTTIEDRLQGLLQRIAADIRETGSVCEHYVKKDFLSKTLKSKVYEERLARHGDLFAKHRQDLQFALSIHTALGIEEANRKLDAQSDQLKSIEKKVDMIALFRKLDSPRERELRQLIEANGGPEACLENDDLLKEIVEKSGETSAMEGSGGRHGNLMNLKQKLSQELAEDLDKALQRNLLLFERKLEMHGKQLSDELQEKLHEQESHIISAILSGAHDRITDEDMKAIWKDMGWKGSVKARHFVLALHDYFIEKLNQSHSESSEFLDTRALRVQDDLWTLSYINVSHVQPILEAIDDDGTGFISIKEVNTFTSSRPEGWTLPNWIAYWAAGWHVSIHLYKAKIYSLVRQMAGSAQGVLFENRRFVDEYLTHSTFTRLELFLRSTKDVNAQAMVDADLMTLTSAYTAAEEEKLERHLESVAYELDCPATVSLVTGPGRIERFIYPLLYLVLKRHQKVICLAQNYILDSREFGELTLALSSLFDVLEERAEGLASIFKQSHSDIKERLGHFAFGLLLSSYGNPERDPKNNTLFTWDLDGLAGEKNSKERSSRLITTDILKHSAQTRNSKRGSSGEDTWHLGLKCDACCQEIIGSRLLCLTCMTENFSDNINLCFVCRKKTPANDHFSHLISHSLLEVDDVILDGELSWIIPKARAKAHRVKDALRSYKARHDDPHGGSRVIDSDAIVSNCMKSILNCFLCSNVLDNSCWVTLNTEGGMYYYCDDCHFQNSLSSRSRYRDAHLPGSKLESCLLNVRYVEEALSTDGRLENLEKRMMALETRTEAHLKSLESKVDSCLKMMESLIRQMSSHGAVRAGPESGRLKSY